MMVLGSPTSLVLPQQKKASQWWLYRTWLRMNWQKETVFFTREPLLIQYASKYSRQGFEDAAIQHSQKRRVNICFAFGVNAQ